jgi:hypothetical protein
VTAPALLPTIDFWGAHAPLRALVGAPADAQPANNDQEKSPDADRSAEDLGEGAEIGTRGRVRSPEIDSPYLRRSQS